MQCYIMESEKANVEENEFEPDNHFFDNFLDGMDVLVDKCGDSEEERWITGRSDEECEISSGEDRMVIDLGRPSSPESNNSGQLKSNAGSDIQEILTDRVLAHLEMNSSFGKTKNDASFPSHELIIDVLERLKKSVQRKSKSPLRAGTGTAKEAAKDDTRHSRRAIGAASNMHVSIASIESNESSEETYKNGPHLTMKWGFRNHRKSRSEEQPACSSREINGSQASTLDKRHKRRKKHKKRKAKKSREDLFVRHKRRTGKKCKKRVRVESSEEEQAVNSNLSLESISSENENDILNELEISEKELHSVSCHKSAKLDCEEGEVLSSSSDWEYKRVKRRRVYNSPSPPRQKYLSRLTSASEGLWPRRDRRSSTPSPPPPPPWLHQRRQPEEHGRYMIPQIRSPTHHVHMTPWRDSWSDKSRGRVANPRLRSVSPVSRHRGTRSRSPIGGTSPAELPSPFTDHFGHLIEIRPLHRHFHRPRSPPEEIRESRRLLERCCSTMNIRPRETISCCETRTERRFSPDSGDERREKPSLVLRCLQEIKHRPHVPGPGRFVHDPELKDSVQEADRAVSRYSSPLLSSGSRLKFTTPTTKNVGTSSSSLRTETMSIGCQTDEGTFLNLRIDQASQCQQTSELLHGFKASSEDAGSSMKPFLTDEETFQARTRVSVEDNVDTDNIIERVPVTPSAPVTNETLPSNALQMWKSIVSFRYPDLNDKEREQVILMKSMEAEKTGPKQEKSS